MKLDQTVTWIERGMFETEIIITDENGDVIRELNHTYEQTGSFPPCYKSLMYALQPFHDATVDVTTSHEMFRKELLKGKDMGKSLAYRLAELLEQNNITLNVIE